MNEIVLYTKTDCPNCDVAKVALYRANIEYTAETVTPEAIENLKNIYGVGIRSLPVLEIVGEGVYTYDKLHMGIDTIRKLTTEK